MKAHPIKLTGTIIKVTPKKVGNYDIAEVRIITKEDGKKSEGFVAKAWGDIGIVLLEQPIGTEIECVITLKLDVYNDEYPKTEVTLQGFVVTQKVKKEAELPFAKKDDKRTEVTAEDMASDDDLPF